MSRVYWTCTCCGANLDPGEKCDCEKPIQMNSILAAVAMRYATVPSPQVLHDIKSKLDEKQRLKSLEEKIKENT